MLRRLYDWTLDLAGHRHAQGWLAGISFAESSVFPVPVDALLVPMILARVELAFRLALIATVFSVLGGVAGYGIGALLFDQVGAPILDLYGYRGKFEDFAALYHEWRWWIIVIAGFTPLPYKVVTIASGVALIDLWVFIIASVLSRGARFFLEAVLLFWFGPPIRRFVEQRLGLVALVTVAAGIAGFAAVRYLF